MPGQRCPECGGRLATTRRTNPREDPPANPDVDKNLAAEDVDHRADLTVKTAMLVCQDCGATLQTPDL